MGRLLLTIFLILVAAGATGCGKQMRDYIGVIPAESLVPPPFDFDPFGNAPNSVRVSSGYGVTLSPTTTATVVVGHVEETVVSSSGTQAVVRLSNQRMQ